MTDFDLVGELECVWEVQAICGEGPLWIEADQSLYFVDIDDQKLHCYKETSNARSSLDLEEKTGWVLPLCFQLCTIWGMRMVRLMSTVSDTGKMLKCP